MASVTNRSPESEVHGIVLAAGRGRRMGDATAYTPKCLQVIQGRTLLDHVLEAFREAKVSNVAVVTGYRAARVEELVQLTFHNERWATTNMVASLRMADSWLSSFPCVVSYSDIFYGGTAIRRIRESDAELAVLFDRNWLSLWSQRFTDPLSDAEVFRLEDNRYIIEIGQDPRSISDVEGQFMGLWSITPPAWKRMKTLLEGMPESLQDSIDTTSLFQRWIDAGLGPIEAIEFSGVWGEVDNETDLALYNNMEDLIIHEEDYLSTDRP